MNVLSVSGGSVTEGSDYRARTGTLTFTAWTLTDSRAEAATRMQ